MSLGTSNGFEIVTGHGEWISEPVFLARWIYLVALIVATISIVGVLAWPHFKKQLSSPIVLFTVTASIASCSLFLISAVWIFPVPKFILFEPFFSSPFTILLLVIHAAFWTIPVIMWLWYALRGPKALPASWPALRLSIAVFYFAVWISVCKEAIAALMLGVHETVAYFIGTFLLWWSYARLTDSYSEARIQRMQDAR